VLDHGVVARMIVKDFQVGGLWRPARNLKAWRQARVASFLSKLGWLAVADDIYDASLIDPPLHVQVAEQAINHAIVCFEASQTPESQQFYLDRIMRRSARLAEDAPNHPTAQYGLAYVEHVKGQLLAAVNRLTVLKQKRQDLVVLDLLARIYGELGDQAAPQEEQVRLWQQAIRSWRERLTRYRVGPGTFRAYLRLGDLFTRLEDPLLARSNYMLALNEPDLPPELVERVRQQIRALELQLFGSTFVPDSTQTTVQDNPFTPLTELRGAYPAPGPVQVPAGQPYVPGSAVPIERPTQPPREDIPRQDVTPTPTPNM